MYKRQPSRSGGMEQPGEVHKVMSVMTHEQFRIFDGWWHHQQNEGVRGFTMPLLSSTGLRNIQVRAVAPWSALVRAGDVEVTLNVEVTRPPILSIYEGVTKEWGMTDQDWADVSKNAIGAWKSFGGSK